MTDAAHKPQPVRNGRGFLKEYAVIVVGVLTALAAQQAAEWWQWRNEVVDARAALREEMTNNNRGFFARRAAIAPCLERQFSQAETILAGLEAGHRPEKPVLLRPASGNLVTDAEWQSQRASQVLTHFPHAELAGMNRYYAIAMDMRSWMANEAMAWQELSILQNPPAGITTSDLIRLRVNLGIAQRFGYLILINSRRQLQLSRELGLGDTKPEPLLVKYFCSTLTPEEYRLWLKRVELR